MHRLSDNILKDVNLIEEDILVNDQGYKVNIYTPTEFWINAFKDYKKRSLINVPYKLPMLVQPKKYLNKYHILAYLIRKKKSKAYALK